jgi:hypothetical protein
VKQIIIKTTSPQVKKKKNNSFSELLGKFHGPGSSVLSNMAHPSQGL